MVHNKDEETKRWSVIDLGWPQRVFNANEVNLKVIDDKEASKLIRSFYMVKGEKFEIRGTPQGDRNASIISRSIWW